MRKKIHLHVKKKMTSIFIYFYFNRLNKYHLKAWELLNNKATFQMTTSGGSFTMHRTIDNFDLIGLTITVASLIRIALG